MTKKDLLEIIKDAPMSANIEIVLEVEEGDEGEMSQDYLDARVHDNGDIEIYDKRLSGWSGR